MDWLIQRREKFLSDWYNFNVNVFFLLLSFIYISLLFLKRIFILDNIAAFDILQERGDLWIFDIFYGLQYFSVPLFLIWKLTLTTFLLWIGSFMFGYKLTFRQIWKWVMFCELVFVAPEILKIFWFTLFSPDPNYQDYLAFYPFSLLNFFDHTSVSQKFHYPLKSINLFEVVYFLALTLGIYILSNKRLNTSSYIVLSSYVLFYIVWLGFYSLVYD